MGSIVSVKRGQRGWYNRAMHRHHHAAIDKLTARFQPDPRFLALLIIGSIARGEARADSDIDFYLISWSLSMMQRTERPSHNALLS